MNSPRKPRNKRHARAAAAMYASLRGAGTPTQVTAHEAHRLSDGRLGQEGDHSTPVRLIDVAIAVTRHAITA